MGISITEASLLALFLETLLYGVFLTLYLISLSILLTKTGIQRQLLIPVVTLLLCIATAHLVIGFVRALEAFVFNVQTINADTYYFNLASPLNLAKTALYITQTVLADAVIVWRCYVVNHRSLWVAIPGCIALLTNATTGCYVVWSLSRNPVGLALPTTVDGCITTFYSLTMITSVICTSLIAWRIYHVPSFIPDGSSSLLPIFIAIIETGALYAMSVLALLIASLTGYNGQFVQLDIVTPIVGIAFCLVILQVHFRIGSNFPAERPAETIGIIAARRDAWDTSSIGHTSTLPTNVHITEETETEKVQFDMIGRNMS